MNSPLHGQLSCYRLYSEVYGPFEALSYAWGSVSTPRTILLGGKHFKIGQNLFDALQALRLRGQPRYLWVDALCINQADDAEKTEQVSFMGQIYAHAERVVVWLGEGLSREHDFKVHQLFRWMSMVVWDPWREGGILHRVPSLSTILQHFNDLRLVHSFSDNTVHPDVTLTDIQEFHSRPWFSRRWIVQEICNARQITVYFGDYQLDWRSLSLALDCLASAPEESQCLQRYPFQRLLIWKRGVKVDSVLRDMEFFSHLEGSDDRDRVASLTNLGWPHTAPGSDFVVSYSESIEENYYRLAVHMVTIGKGANVLIAASNSHRGTRNGELGLPSWVPDWRAMRERRITSVPSDEGFEVEVLQGKLLKFSGRVWRTYTSNPSPDNAGDAYIMRPSQLLRLPIKGDIVCSLVTRKGTCDINCLVLRPSGTFEQYTLVAGMLVHWDSTDGTSNVYDTTKVQGFLIE